MSIGASGHWGKIWALGENEHQEKLVPGQTSRLFAANEHFGSNELLGTLSIGAGGHWGEMGTRKNEHQGKLTFEANGHLGSMDIGANGHWGKMGTRKNEHLSK